MTEDANRRIDIATRLVLRMLDEDETVKELAIKSVEELWFPPTPLPSALKGKSQMTTTENPHDKTALFSKVSIIMGTAAHFKDRQSPLEDLLHKIMKDKEGLERNSLNSRYGEICEALIDGLVDASDLPGFVGNLFFFMMLFDQLIADHYQLCPNDIPSDICLSIGAVRNARIYPPSLCQKPQFGQPSSKLSFVFVYTISLARRILGIRLPA